jgi:hypothetical protein
MPQRAELFCSVIAAQEISTMASDQTKQRAERKFKQEERRRDGRQAMIEYEVQAIAIRKKTAHLKALRLAKEAQAQTEEPPAKPARQRPARRRILKPAL